MEAALSTGAALLQLLRQGPRYGRGLIRALERQAGEVVRPCPGTLYRAAEGLRQRGLLRTWTVSPGGRRGARSRRYYELTSQGIRAAEKQREAMAALLALRGRPPLEIDPVLMAERLHRAAELSAFARRLQRGLAARARRVR
jgi:DNA-binding PadR family transcriptional regulator